MSDVRTNEPKHATKSEHKKPVRSTSAAAEIASKVELKTVRMSSFSANCFQGFDSLPEAPEIRVKFGFTEPRIDQNKDGVTVTTTLIFSLLEPGKDKADSAPKQFVVLRATTALEYAKAKGVGELSDESLRDFGRINAPFNAWGYWREFVQSSLARLDYPTFTLPLFRVGEAASFLLKDE